MPEAHATNDRYCHMIRKVVGPGRLSVGRCSRSRGRNQRVTRGSVGRLRYTVRHESPAGLRPGLFRRAERCPADRRADHGRLLAGVDRPRLWGAGPATAARRAAGAAAAGDTLVVWRLDRLGRSLRHLIEVVTALDDRGVGFRSLRESIDTTAPGGRLVFHLFGVLAQFEREIIRDRTMAGLAAARARGRSGGPALVDTELGAPAAGPPARSTT